MNIIPVRCGNCGKVIANRAERTTHSVLVSAAHLRNGELRWSAIASCDARIVGAGSTFEAAIISLDAAADRASRIASRTAERPAAPIRSRHASRSAARYASPDLECVLVARPM